MKFQEWHNRPEVKTKGYLDEESFLRVDQFRDMLRENMADPTV